MTQQPDTQPGNYYVTVRDGERYQVLAGPFPNDHAKALALVDSATQAAYQLDPRAPWYAYGTARMETSFTKPGILNGKLGL